MPAQKNTKKRLLKYRLMLILPYLIAGILLIPLVFIKQFSTPVIINLTTHRIAFKFIRNWGNQESEGGSFFHALPLEEVRFSHFNKFLIPFANAEIRSGPDNNFKPLVPEKSNAQRIMTVTPADTYASIIFENTRLNELYLQKSARVILAVPAGEPQTVLFSVDGCPTAGKINIPEIFTVECQNCILTGVYDQNQNNLNYFRITPPGSSEGIDFQSSKNNFLISMELKKDAKISEKEIYIEDVEFLQKRGSGNIETSLVSPEGEIILEDLNNRKIEIMSGDFIKIGKSKNLRITQMTFQNNGIRLTLRGNVGELRTGPMYTKKDLSSHLPSVLEWIYNRQPLVLYLSALVLVASTIMTILQHLRITPK